MAHLSAQPLEHLKRSLRVVLVATALVAAVIPSLSVAAHTADALQIDSPTPNATVSNGDMLLIGGWTAGSRVDAYLDGPAGIGRGIGSTVVGGPRPDVARATGSPSLANSGFELAFEPMDLTAGVHTLYVYSLVDGSWISRTVPIMSRGNVYFPFEAATGNESRDDASEALEL